MMTRKPVQVHDDEKDDEDEGYLGVNTRFLAV